MGRGGGAGRGVALVVGAFARALLWSCFDHGPPCAGGRRPKTGSTSTQGVDVQVVAPAVSTSSSTSAPPSALGSPGSESVIVLEDSKI